MHAGIWLGWPIQGVETYQGLQAHEVFQDLIKIYQSSPATAWMPPYYNETETPKLSFSYLKIEFFSLKLLSVFIRKRK